MGAWVLLGVAVVAEVVATVALRYSVGLSRLWPTVLVVAGYGVAFWLLSRVLLALPASVTYAVWAGAGTALVALVGVVALGEGMTWAKAASLLLIVAGVVGLNVFGGGHDGSTKAGATLDLAAATVAPAATVGADIADAPSPATRSSSPAERSSASKYHEPLN